MKDTLQLGSRGATVRELQTALNALGGNLSVDGDFGDNTFDAVCDFQTSRSLDPDGVVGPKTWSALEDGLVKLRYQTAALEADKLALAGRKAVERALAMWNLDIYDPKREDRSSSAVASRTYIDDMIRSGLGWTWEPPYRGDGDFEWCGAFAAACWYDVKAELRKLYFSSTYRLDRYAAYRSYNGEMNVGKGRLYAQLDENSSPPDVEKIVRPGDILLIGPKGYGQHICLVESFEVSATSGRGYFNTVEGNGGGSGPNGEKQHGVIRSKRPLGQPRAGTWHARRLIRPSIDDL